MSLEYEQSSEANIVAKPVESMELLRRKQIKYLIFEIIMGVTTLTLALVGREEIRRKCNTPIVSWLLVMSAIYFL